VSTLYESLRVVKVETQQGLQLGGLMRGLPVGWHVILQISEPSPFGGHLLDIRSRGCHNTEEQANTQMASLLAENPELIAL
jgi:hypothetical protein